MKSSFIDNKTKRYVDTLYLLLIHNDEYSFLPELYEVFGKEHLIRFLQLFAGSTVKVPSESILTRNVRDVSIYIRLDQCKTGESRGLETAELMTELGISDSEIAKIYRNMKSLVNQYNISRVLK